MQDVTAALLPRLNRADDAATVAGKMPDRFIPVGEDAAIASAALSMARDLGIEVVAEGVETEAQRAYLEARGCRIMQGYLFSRPLSVADFEQRLPPGSTV
ncbi:EAL domain-containing protein [Rhodocyclaceae bacterium SMB388]